MKKRIILGLILAVTLEVIGFDPVEWQWWFTMLTLAASIDLIFSPNVEGLRQLARAIFDEGVSGLSYVKI